MEPTGPKPPALEGILNPWIIQHIIDEEKRKKKEEEDAERKREEERPRVQIDEGNPDANPEMPEWEDPGPGYEIETPNGGPPPEKKKDDGEGPPSEKRGVWEIKLT